MVAIVAVAAAGCTQSDGPSPDPTGQSTPVSGPLSILLVNDDGWNAPGITALYDLLVADGHEVTLVAPLENQSGRSMATGSDPLEVTRPAGTEPKYAVDGTPVDALTIGLLGILKDDPPDVVLSGVNTGANVAGNTNYSGTVGAAAAAAEKGFPALAISADVGGPTAEGDYDDAALIVADLVERLAGVGFDGLGHEGFINVNVPFETEARTTPRGSRVVPLADAAPRTVDYSETQPGTWTPTPRYDGRAGPAGADASQLADGWTTLTFLPVARVAVPAGQKWLKGVIAPLNADR
ncbi:MAG: 5'/3'-nucleotidase SurE [Aeromicrobium sp.]